MFTMTSLIMLAQYLLGRMWPVPSPLMVLALAWSPRLPDRAEMAGMKLTIRVRDWITCTPERDRMSEVIE